MNDRKWTILSPAAGNIPACWLSGVHGAFCGTRFHLEFSSLPSCALALTHEDAEKLLESFKKDHLPPYRARFDKAGKLLNPRVYAQIVEVPWLHSKEAQNV